MTSPTEQLLDQIEFNKAMNAGDAVAQIGVLLNLDDQAIYRTFPQLESFDGELVFTNANSTEIPQALKGTERPPIHFEYFLQIEFTQGEFQPIHIAARKDSPPVMESRYNRDIFTRGEILISQFIDELCVYLGKDRASILATYHFLFWNENFLTSSQKPISIEDKTNAINQVRASKQEPLCDVYLTIDHPIHQTLISLGGHIWFKIDELDPAGTEPA